MEEEKRTQGLDLENWYSVSQKASGTVGLGEEGYEGTRTDFFKDALMATEELEQREKESILQLE